MEDKKNESIFTTLAREITPNNIQKYLLGTKKNGQPRAVYDIVKDAMGFKKKHKKGKKKKPSNYDLYLGLKKKHKKNKKKKYWSIYGD